MQSDRSSIESEVKSFLMESFFKGEDSSVLSSDTPLISGNLMDSISVTKLVIFLEERYGIDVKLNEISENYLDTITSIANLVIQKKSA